MRARREGVSPVPIIPDVDSIPNCPTRNTHRRARVVEFYPLVPRVVARRINEDLGDQRVVCRGDVIPQHQGEVDGEDQRRVRPHPVVLKDGHQKVVGVGRGQLQRYLPVGFMGSLGAVDAAEMHPFFLSYPHEEGLGVHSQPGDVSQTAGEGDGLRPGQAVQVETGGEVAAGVIIVLIQQDTDLRALPGRRHQRHYPGVQSHISYSRSPGDHLVQLHHGDRISCPGPVQQSQQAVVGAEEVFRAVQDSQRRRRRRQEPAEGGGVGGPVRRGEGGVARRRSVGGIVVRRDVYVDRVGVPAEDLRQPGCHAGAVGHQQKAPVARRPVDDGVGGHRALGEVVGADQRQVVVHQNVLGVLVAVAGARSPDEVDGGRRRVMQPLYDPFLVRGHPAGGLAFQEDGHHHSSLDALPDGLVDWDALQSIGRNLQGTPGRANGLQGEGKGPLGNDGDRHLRRGGNLGGEEEVLQVPAGVAEFAAPERVLRVLGPVGGGVGIGDGEAGGGVQFAVEDLAGGEAGVRVRDSGAGPALGGGAGAVGQRVHHHRAGDQKGRLAAVGEAGPGVGEEGDRPLAGSIGPVRIKAPYRVEAVAVPGQPKDAAGPDLGPSGETDVGGGGGRGNVVQAPAGKGGGVRAEVDQGGRLAAAGIVDRGQRVEADGGDDRGAPGGGGGPSARFGRDGGEGRCAGEGHPGPQGDGDADGYAGREVAHVPAEEVRDGLAEGEGRGVGDERHFRRERVGEDDGGGGHVAGVAQDEDGGEGRAGQDDRWAGAGQRQGRRRRPNQGNGPGNVVGRRHLRGGGGGLGGVGDGRCLERIGDLRGDGDEGGGGGRGQGAHLPDQGGEVGLGEGVGGGLGQEGQVRREGVGDADGGGGEGVGVSYPQGIGYQPAGLGRCRAGFLHHQVGMRDGVSGLGRPIDGVAAGIQTVADDAVIGGPVGVGVGGGGVYALHCAIGW